MECRAPNDSMVNKPQLLSRDRTMSEYCFAFVIKSVSSNSGNSKTTSNSSSPDGTASDAAAMTRSRNEASAGLIATRAFLTSHISCQTGPTSAWRAGPLACDYGAGGGRRRRVALVGREDKQACD